MSTNDELSPTRFHIFREAWAVLNESKSIEEARKKFRELVLTMVLGASP